MLCECVCVRPDACVFALLCSFQSPPPSICPSFSSHTPLSYTHAVLLLPPKDSSPPRSCPIPSPMTQHPHTCPGMTLEAHRKMTLTAHRMKGDDCITRVLPPFPPKPTNPSLAHTPHWVRSFFFLHYSNFTGLGSFYTQCVFFFFSPSM